MIHHCFKCDKKLDPVFDEEGGPQHYDALTFRAPGNYGSRVFDPMSITNTSGLIILICDECILENQSQVILHRPVRPEPVDDYEPFVPDELPN